MNGREINCVPCRCVFVVMAIVIGTPTLDGECRALSGSLWSGEWREGMRECCKTCYDFCLTAEFPAAGHCVQAGTQHQ